MSKRTESEMCIGHTTMSKSQNGLPHLMYSAVECITNPDPADDERLESTFHPCICNNHVILNYIVVAFSMPDSDDDHDMNGMW